MNWALLLAEYPRALMQDKFPILILAFVERKGLTTETELVQHVRIEPHKLSAILIDLHRNQFIEFGRNSVRVSDRGKILLERFNTHSGVIEDFLDSLPLQGLERTAYRLVVRNYRDKAFPQYLNSLCSIKTWEYIADKTQPKRDERYEVATRVGKLTLLIRDLRNWFVHARPPINLFDSLSEDVRKAITMEEEQTLTDESNPPSRAVFWLRALDQSHAELRSQLLDKESGSLMQSLWLLDDFQKTWEKNEWFDSWCDAEWVSKAETGERFLYFLSRSLPKGRRAELQRKLGRDLLGSSYWWIDQPADTFSNDFLGKLMLAFTLDELSSISGMNKESLRTTLSDIQQRCGQLLIAADENALPRVNVLKLRVEMSSDARKDCENLAVPPEEPIRFVFSEAARHPLLFQKDFTSLSLVFHENVLLLSLRGSVATIERILNRREAYPLNDDWSECLAVYRQASLLPYRTKGLENLQSPAEAQRVFAVFQGLVSKANNFLESLRRNEQPLFEAYGDMSLLVEEAKLALESNDLATAAARLEVVLSTVHRLILENAPQGPFSSRGSPQTTIIEIPSTVKGTILLVDDEKVWLYHMRHLLESKNFTIVVASNTVEALRALVNHEFDLVITDLVMGGESDRNEGDGREVALAAKKGSHKTKVVVLTGYQQMSLKASLFESGVDVIVFKTEPPQDILDKIDTTLEKIEKPQPNI